MSNVVSNLAVSLGLNAPGNIAEKMPDRTPAAPRQANRQQGTRVENEPVGRQKRVAEARNAETEDRGVDARQGADNAPATDVVQKRGQDFREVLEKRMSRKNTSKEGDTVGKKGDSRKEQAGGQENAAFVAVPGFAGQVAIEVLTAKNNLASKTRTSRQGQKMALTNKAAKAGVAVKVSATGAEGTTEKAQQTEAMPIQGDKTSAAAIAPTEAAKEVQKAEPIVAEGTKNAKSEVKTAQNIKEIPVEAKKDTAEGVKTLTEVRLSQAEKVIKPERVSRDPGSIVTKNSDSSKQSTVGEIETALRSRAVADETDIEADSGTGSNKSGDSVKRGVEIPDSQGEPKSNSSVGTDRAKGLAGNDDVSEQGESANIESIAAAVKAIKETDAFAVMPSDVKTTRPVDNTQSISSPGSVNSSNSMSGGVNGLKSPGEQIIESIRLNANGQSRQIDINLNPSELGSVRIRLSQSNGEITGIIEVNKPETRYEIEKEIPEIVASLQNNGLQVKRVEVVMNQQQGDNNTGHRQADDFGAPQGKEFGAPSERRSDSGMNSSNPNESRADHPVTTDRGGQVSDDAINVYV
jgi:flagellar hook-length control protein FliK